MPVHATDSSSYGPDTDKGDGETASQNTCNPAYSGLSDDSSSGAPGNLSGDWSGGWSGGDALAPTSTSLDNHQGEPDDNCQTPLAKINPFDDIFAIFDD